MSVYSRSIIVPVIILIASFHFGVLKQCEGVPRGQLTAHCALKHKKNIPIQSEFVGMTTHLVVLHTKQIPDNGHCRKPFKTYTSYQLEFMHRISISSQN
ncbi:hypothetical protein CEXT_74211 [Caerostris extrusa]|uniref:Uncharacterized protein n=1 Tax=Caerostris extrusa TaxID=172846 RepID=A0AAV4UWF6_CAEEX|nr:hypothetical protein CEXT_74211 [Caerostris extrusa]